MWAMILLRASSTSLRSTQVCPACEKSLSLSLTLTACVENHNKHALFETVSSQIQKNLKKTELEAADELQGCTEIEELADEHSIG